MTHTFVAEVTAKWVQIVARLIKISRNDYFQEKTESDFAPYYVKDIIPFCLTSYILANRDL